MSAFVLAPPPPSFSPSSRVYSKDLGHCGIRVSSDWVHVPKENTGAIDSMRITSKFMTEISINKMCVTSLEFRQILSKAFKCKQKKNEIFE